MSELDEVDVAVVARRSEGAWRLDELPDRALKDASSLLREVEGRSGDAVLALVSVGEDFAVLVRSGDALGPSRVVLSDASAAIEWDLAASVLDLLGLDVPDDEEDPAPAGDLTLLADLDVDADDLATLIDDEEHPDDLLVGVADELGFADELEDFLDSDSDTDSDSDEADDSDDDSDDDALDELEDDDLLDDLDDEFDADDADELAEDEGDDPEDLADDEE